jgi:hypothetical protein
MLCPHCGYDLAGLSSAVCPECGNEVPRIVPTPRTDARLNFVRVIGTAGWLVYITGLVAIMVRLSLAFVCPGTPLMVGLGCIIPWMVMLSHIRFKKSLADDLFVACLPWFLNAFFAAILLSVFTS